MKYTIFGESHGPAIGVVLEGVPAGLELDMGQISAELARRAPGKTAVATARSEADQREILSGVFQGRTTGAALAPSRSTSRSSWLTSMNCCTCISRPQPRRAFLVGAGAQPR